MTLFYNFFPCAMKAINKKIVANIVGWEMKVKN